MWYQRKAGKFNAKKTFFNGRTYDSRLEATVAEEIDLLLKAKIIKKVEPQVTFPLYGKNGAKICSHKPDFLLTFADGHKEVWEAKGFATPVFGIKLKLFEDNYPDIKYTVITSKGNWYTKKMKK